MFAKIVLFSVAILAANACKQTGSEVSVANESSAFDCPAVRVAANPVVKGSPYGFAEVEMDDPSESTNYYCSYQLEYSSSNGVLTAYGTSSSGKINFFVTGNDIKISRITVKSIGSYSSQEIYPTLKPKLGSTSTTPAYPNTPSIPPATSTGTTPGTPALPNPNGNPSEPKDVMATASCTGGSVLSISVSSKGISNTASFSGSCKATTYCSGQTLLVQAGPASYMTFVLYSEGECQTAKAKLDPVLAAF